MGLWSDIFGKKPARGTWKLFEEENKSIARFEEFVGKEFHGVFMESGCPCCGDDLDMDWACRWITCRAGNCGLGNVIFDCLGAMEMCINRIEDINS